MIRSTKELERLERDYARDCEGRRTYAWAAAVFQALWDEARALNPDFPGDWEGDIEPDLRVARAVNGLPPG